MRILICSVLFLGLATTLLIGNGRPVHLRPQADSPVIGNLPIDSVMVSPAEPVNLSAAEREQGWRAISFLDNFRGYVRESEVRKDFSITVGAPIYLSAAEDSSTILVRATRNDVFEIESLDGTWAEVSFRKPLTGFVRDQQENGTQQESQTSATIVESIEDQTVTGEAAPEASRVPTVRDRPGIPNDGILRSFEGWLTPTRSFFGRTPPYAHQIVDQSGNRIAFLDLSKLLITTPLDRFYGRQYEVYGQAEAIEGRRDFVIRVERMLQK